MLYIRLANHAPVEVATSHPKDMKPEDWAFGPNGEARGDGWITRNDIRSFQYASTLAELLTERLGKKFLGTDAGDGVSPRYDVIAAPVVGDLVSKTFNGDSYPCGTITKVTPTWQITTSTGARFRRYRQSAGWRETGRGFWMTSGHVDERNPHL